MFDFSKEAIEHIQVRDGQVTVTASAEEPSSFSVGAGGLVPGYSVSVTETYDISILGRGIDDVVSVRQATAAAMALTLEKLAAAVEAHQAFGVVR